MADVVVDLSGKEVLRVSLKGPSMVIGRDPQCDVHLDNRALSRRHAQIEKRGAALWVKDLGSANGTFVNGAKLAEPQVLNGGDRIELGRYQIRIEGVEEARQDTPVITLTGPEGRHRFAMVGDEIIIGRAPACDIAIAHKSISRRHLRIAVEDDHFVAEDLGSQNGSRINNKRIAGPTPFRIGDKVQMSEFQIEVGYLEPSPQTGNGAPGQKPSGRTMIIDKSELAKAAYVGGDGLPDAAGGGNIQLGGATPGVPSGPPQVPHVDDLGADDLYEESTRGIPELDEAELALPPAPPRPGVGPTKGQPAAQQPRPSTPQPPAPSNSVRPPVAPPKPQPRVQPPWVTVTHPDHGERELLLDGELTVLGEDGTDGDTSEGRAFANQGYVLFVRTARGVVATVAGDRRLLTVNGRAQLSATLSESDSVELGLLTIVFHSAG